MAHVLTVFSLLVLSLLVGYGVASHFRGAIIQWKPVNNGQIRFFHRIAWRRTYSPNLNCTSSDIGTDKLFGTGDLVCANGCSGLVGNLSFFCTDVSVLEDWVSGERSFTYNIDPNLIIFEAVYSSCCWISTLVIGRDGNWNVKVKVDLTVRPDGRINSSPVTATRPIYRLQHGCRHVISIPVGDPDGDIVRCRWANGSLGECGGVCNGFPNAMLNMEQCTISYVATGALGWYAVTIQIEDFLNSSSQSPLSSVPVQFLVIVFNSAEPCDAKPILVPGETPPDGSCIPVEFGTTYTAGIVATSGGLSIIEFPTVSPFGLIVSGINQSVYNSSLYYVNVTWTPTLEQFGLNIFCFSATNSERVTSNQSCIELLGGVQGPRIIPSSITPTGIFTPCPTTLWSVIFDQSVRRPESSRFIEVYQAEDDSLVHRIDVTSSDVTFPLPDSEERTVTFRFDYSFVTGTSYYLLFQGGAAVGDMFCNQESHRITNTTFWTFTVGCPQGYIECFPSSNKSLSFNVSSSNISATCECVSNTALCNGTEECSTGFDETECEETMLGSGSGEEFCCPQGYIECFPLSNNSLSFNTSSSNISATCECVSNTALCNGTKECSTGFDETECEEIMLGSGSGRDFLLPIEVTITPSKPPSVLIGDYISFYCSPKFFPGDDVSFIWRHLNSSRILEETSSTLILPRISLSKLGTYRCTATATEIRGSADITLESKRPVIQSGAYGFRSTNNDCPSSSVKDDILVDVLQLLASEHGAHPLGLTPSYPAASCDQVSAANPGRKTGLYWVGSGDNVKKLKCEL